MGASAVNTARSWLFWVHLTLGVTAGAAIFTMSVTGALLALQPQILEWLERHQRIATPPPGVQRFPPGALLAAATHGRTSRDPMTLTLSADPSRTAVVSLGRDGVRYVDPYRGVVVGEGARLTRRAFQWLTEFHRWFASPPQWRAAARGVTGWSTLAFVLLTVSGLVLWIPRRLTRGTLVRSMTPGWAPTPKARHFNWHTVFGFWCAPVLLVLALTGVVLAFPWANRLLFEAAGTPLLQTSNTTEVASRTRSEQRPVESGAVPDYRAIDAAWRVAEQQLPTWQTIALRIQGRADGPLSFTITDAAHWNRFARSQLTMSGETGTVLRWEPYREITRGQRWRGWARFAHTGELGGVAGQLLAGAASAGAALLVWTGLSLGLRRLFRTRDVARGIAGGSPGSLEAQTTGRALLTRTEQRS